jgi:hypothetical protein
MSDPRVLGEVSLAGHVPIGQTIHRRGNQVLPAPTRLELAQYEGDSGVYLFYYNGDVEQTDTYHETLALALEQAQFEFDIRPSEWTFKKNDQEKNG